MTSVNALTQADRRPQPADRQRQGHRPDAERPARPARHRDRRPREDRPGDDDRGRRRQRRRLHRRRPEAGARRRTRHDHRRVPDRLRSRQGAARHHRRRDDARLSRRLHRRRLDRRPAASSRTTISATRATCSARWPRRSPARLNAQQALGLDLGQPAGAGAPLLSVGAASAPPSSNNAKAGGVPVASYVNGSGVRVSSVSISVVATNELQPSDYELVADPTLAAGQLHADPPQRRRRAARSSTASVVDGFRIDIAAPAPRAARPLPAAAGRAGDRARCVRALDDPKGIAAASPVTAPRSRRPTPAPRRSPRSPR